MTLKEQELENIKNATGNIPHNVRCAYVNGMNLRSLYAEMEKDILFNLGEHPAPEVLRLGNCAGHMFGHVRAKDGNSFATLKIMLDLSEASDAFKESYAVLQPMLDRIAELEAEILAERETAALALHALNEAEAAAREKAEALLAKDPTVAAARKALEAAQPALVPVPVEHPKPFRGTLKIEDGKAVPVEA